MLEFEMKKIHIVWKYYLKKDTQHYAMLKYNED